MSIDDKVTFCVTVYVFPETGKLVTLYYTQQHFDFTSKCVDKNTPDKFWFVSLN